MRGQPGAFTPNFDLLINIADNRYSVDAEDKFLNNLANSLLFARYCLSDDG